MHGSSALAVAGLSVGTLALVFAAGCSGAKPKLGGPFKGNAEDATYVIAGDQVALRAGRATTPGRSGSEVTTTLTEARLDGDLNGDGVTDVVVVLARDEGDGASFFIAPLISAEDGSFTSRPALALGERLVVKGLGFDGPDVRVRLLVRDPKADDPRPSLPVEKRFRYVDGKFAGVIIERDE